MGFEEVLKKRSLADKYILCALKANSGIKSQRRQNYQTLLTRLQF